MSSNKIRDFFKVQGTKRSDSKGKLVLVDTPPSQMPTPNKRLERANRRDQMALLDDKMKTPQKGMNQALAAEKPRQSVKPIFKEETKNVAPPRENLKKDRPKVKSTDKSADKTAPQEDTDMKIEFESEAALKNPRNNKTPA